MSSTSTPWLSMCVHVIYFHTRTTGLKVVMSQWVSRWWKRDNIIWLKSFIKLFFFQELPRAAQQYSFTYLFMESVSQSVSQQMLRGRHRLGSGNNRNILFLRAHSSVEEVTIILQSLVVLWRSERLWKGVPDPGWNSQRNLELPGGATWQAGFPLQEAPRICNCPSQDSPALIRLAWESPG